MKITKLSIKNFRSLKNVTLNELGDMVILIGKNGSGKSNILELLEMFISDLNLFQETPKKYPIENWYQKKNSRNIMVDIEIQFDEAKLKSKGLTIKDTYALHNEKIVKIKIHRELAKNGWKKPKIELKGYPLKYDMNDSVHKDKTINADDIEHLLNIMASIIKEKFVLIRSIRESQHIINLTTRPPIIDTESKRYYIQLANSNEPDQESKWIDSVNFFNRLTGKQLEIRNNEPVFRGENYRLPLEYSGSGDQATLILKRYINDEYKVYCIEEPETRLHHSYQREIYNWLKEMSKKSQIILATHSSVFVNKDNLENTWIVTINSGESKVFKIDNDDCLRTLLIELGIKPSDIFFSNAILFVEGITEREVLPIITRKTKIDISNMTIIPIHGKGKGKYHISVWNEAAKNTNVPAYFILDNNAKQEIRQLEDKGLINEKQYLLLDKDFEDLYPIEIVNEVVNEILGEENNKQEIKEGESIVKQLKNIFKGHPIQWKVVVGVKVAQKMSVEQINKHMGKLIQFLKDISAQT